jgi:hypothetical protein
VAQPDFVEESERPVAHLGLALTQHGRWTDCDVPEGRHVREELEVLEHHAHAPADNAGVLVAGRHRNAVEQDASPVQGLQSVGAAQKRGLARARRPDETNDLAPMNLRRDPVKDG